MSLRMTSPGGILLAAILLTIWSAAAQDGALLGPQPGVLLLKNGQLLRGDITRAGDHYVVTLGVGGEVKLAADKVETQCTDVLAAYDWKLRRLSGEGAAPHLDLAEWCLRHNLHRQCAQQLSLALATEPDHPRLGAVERRLQLAIQAPPQVAAAPPSSTIVGADQLDQMLRELPKGSLERFTTIIQPMLNNRCATSHCHGATSTSEFRLLRPPAGFNPPQRFTQRNLYAALQFVDRDDPANSKLLTLPQQPHGGSKEPAFDARSKSQLADLQKWIEQLAPPKEQAAPTTISAQGMQLSTPLRTPSQDNGEPAPTATAATAPAQRSTPNSIHSGNPSDPNSKLPWRPRDPFDPDIFNRRHATKK
jgi:hypothetical protein